MFDKVIYVCSPYSGNIEENKAFAIKACDFVVKQGFIPYAPHLLFPQFISEKKERSKALSMCIEMIGRCDELWCFPKDGIMTPGMMIERNIAIDLKKPMKDFNINKSMEV